MSDIIERYLKAMLSDDPQCVISRAEVADQFNCVPSQINYVIKTRFTPERGYLVESKRGGGGYIRILKVQASSSQEVVANLIAHVPKAVRESDGVALIQQLFDDGIIDQATGQLMVNILAHQTLGGTDRVSEDRLRSRLLLAFLESLRYQR
ncbi:transcriptional regulator CtsR [Lacticaseibacillus nasuensis JCM 17158]|uniref:Transcriptional regulator CtsR n=2 Tax=Lacticaseibacillus TaxID=2759736 RepID=A0A0R1JRD0_9LACO|nr:transcriptional regulator CtsR [Lacticaseibacillus nasuensis JCM 17158]